MNEILKKTKRAITLGLERGLLELQGRVSYNDITDKRTKIDMEILKKQLKEGTWDYEGIRKRFELYRALLKYSEEKDSWEMVFSGKTVGDIWELLRIGLHYISHYKIGLKEKDNPFLAALYTPFCITYNCPYKDGCLFSVTEDILNLFEIILADGLVDLKYSFKTEVINYLIEFEETIFYPLFKILSNGKLLPTHISSKRKELKEAQQDTYVTLAFISHILKNPLKTKIKITEEVFKNIIEKCFSILFKCYSTNRETISEVPSYLAYFHPRRNRMISIKDTSLAMGLLAGRTLLEIYAVMPSYFEDKDQIDSLFSILITRAYETINSKEIGPTYGRDRYSGMSWCSLSEVPTLINAMDFLLDISENSEKFAFFKDKSKTVDESIKKSVEYLVSCQRKDATWPLVDIDKLKKYESSMREQYWDGIKVFDKRIIEKPDLFNISFSNTFDSLRVLVRAADYIDKEDEKK